MDLLIDFLLALGTNLLASVVAGSLAMAMTLDSVFAMQVVAVTSCVAGLVFLAAHAWAGFKRRV